MAGFASENSFSMRSKRSASGPGTLATFAALTYGNRLTISLSYDPQRLNADQAADLLALLTDGIRSSISSASAELTQPDSQRANEQ